MKNTRLFQKAIDYFFPYRCLACGTLGTNSDGICGTCWSKFNFITKPYCDICCQKFQVNFDQSGICGRCIAAKPNIEMIRSLLEFSPESKKLIHNFKYKDKTNLGKFFAGLIYNRFAEDFKDVDLIAPVPMHKLKRIFRNYNPPQILASELAKQFNKEAIPNLLIKNKMTKNQVGLSKNQRAKNLADSFEVNNNFNINHKVILLIDDVITTGATSNQCSEILKKAGAIRVKLATIAKV